MAAIPAPGSPARPGLGPYVVYLFVCLANLAFAGLCFAAREESPDLALYGMYGATLVWEVVCLWSWYKVTGRVFDAYSLCATAVWLFNGGGLALTQLFAPDPYAVSNALRLPVLRDFTDAGVVSAFHLVLFCLSAMHLGALLAISRWQAAAPAGSGRQGAAAEKDPGLRWVGVLLVGVSLVPALWTIRDAAALVREGGYMALYQAEGGAGDPWYFMLASGLVPGAFYLMGSDLDSRRMRWLGWALIIAFSAAMLALGTRATFYQNMIALLWLFHHGVRRIRKAVWASLLVSGLLLSALVYWSREYAGQSAMSRESFEQAGADATRNLTEPFTEMGSTVLIVIFVLDLVPSERGFGWGGSPITMPFHRSCPAPLRGITSRTGRPRRAG
jgi:hypothetical protein